MSMQKAEKLVDLIILQKIGKKNIFRKEESQDENKEISSQEEMSF